ncbi:2122_t:CDS:2 [Entrophospora sp. SA101]|nr:2122_t:CDS:2 [Entrophospora sp. SA101]
MNNKFLTVEVLVVVELNNIIITITTRTKYKKSLLKSPKDCKIINKIIFDQ